MLPKVRLHPTKAGGLALQLSFTGVRPTSDNSHKRYEIFEYIGNLDVELEINGQVFNPKLVVKLFCELTPEEAKKAGWAYALERARANSPFLQ